MQTTENVTKTDQPTITTQERTPDQFYTEADYAEYRRTGDPNVFEEAVDNLMLENSTLHEHNRDKLLNNPIYLKRRGILAFLEESVDRLTYINLRDEVFNKANHEVSLSGHIDDAIKALRGYIDHAQTEVKLYGEVPTPLDLVNEMLDDLPAEVWSNPDLKWLDNCAGAGVFPLMIVQRLMNGLKDYIRDDRRRYKYIVENMIYVAELQPRNMFLLLCLMDPHDQLDVNIYTGSSLTPGFKRHMDEVWKVDKFDVIVGNPPYQKPGGGSRGSNALWHKFVELDLELLADGGYLALVHPDGWRQPTGKFRHIFEAFMERQILTLKINDIRQGLKTFGMSTSYDHYVVKNTPTTNTLTRVRWVGGEETESDLTTLPFIPNGMVEEYQSLIDGDGPRVEILHSYSAYETRKPYLSKVESEIHNLPCVYTTRKDGTITLRYSSEDHGHFGTPKVFFSNGASTPIADQEGRYGLTEFAYGIVDDPENLDNIVKAMLHPRFIEIMKMAGGQTHRYNRRVLALFRKDFWKDFV